MIIQLQPYGFISLLNILELLLDVDQVAVERIEPPREDHRPECVADSDDGKLEQLGRIHGGALVCGRQSIDGGVLGGEDAHRRRETFLLEPDATTVFNRLLPRYLETVIFDAMLQSLTSEHASRRKNASPDRSEALLGMDGVWDVLSSRNRWHHDRKQEENPGFFKNRGPGQCLPRRWTNNGSRVAYKPRLSML